MLIGSFDIRSFIEKLLLESRLESLSQVEAMLSRIRERYALNDDQYTAIRLAITEALTNAIRHGNKYDPSKKVSLTAIMKSERFLCFTVKDEGEGFDPAAVADPAVPGRGGKGIRLISRLANTMEYAHSGKMLEMCFDLQRN